MEDKKYFACLNDFKYSINLKKKKKVKRDIVGCPYYLAPELFDDVKCTEGHKCHLARLPYKDSDGKDATKFSCYICFNEGEYKDGVYVCE